MLIKMSFKRRLHLGLKKAKTGRRVSLFFSPLPHGNPVITLFLVFLNEPTHDKTNKMACAPSEDSGQPVHPPSLIRVFAVRSVGKDTSFLHADSEDSDQTGRMPRLI